MISRRSPLWYAYLLFGCAFTAALPRVPAEELATLDKRTVQEIKKTLATIRIPQKQKADEKSRALASLKAYRYLAGVPYEDLELDEEMSKMCRAGAKLCSMLGRIEHRPKNPGLPEAEFKLAYDGTSQSNLAFGFKTIAEAVDSWMFDSDASNIDWLGHRRWCLNPYMQKTGFGREGIFSAMFSFDRSRTKVPEFDFISYPVRGYMPVEYFKPNQAWSVTLNPKKFKTPGKDYKPLIHRADAAGAPRGEPLQLDFATVNAFPFGIPNCVIFRPKKFKLAPGSRFVVELPDIVPQGKGPALTLQYVVEFVTLKSK